MNKIIYIGIYDLINHRLYIKTPFKITKETKHNYIVYNEHGHYSNYYRKPEEGKVIHRSKKYYPYLTVYFVDVDNPEQKIREAFCDWFKAVGELILVIKEV